MGWYLVLRKREVGIESPENKNAYTFSTEQEAKLSLKSPNQFFFFSPSSNRKLSRPPSTRTQDFFSISSQSQSFRFLQSNIERSSEHQPSTKAPSPFMDELGLSSPHFSWQGSFFYSLFRLLGFTVELKIPVSCCCYCNFELGFFISNTNKPS